MAPPVSFSLILSSVHLLYYETSENMRYQGIKVTLVTGFLGAGKTTLIRHLLEQSPANERWAVLVNEFGDIGLDGAFYSDLGVAIAEVAGGCVCCTTSAAFQQGLNQLIRKYNPDRIFIEPSGLGHPKQIIQQLRGHIYSDVLLLSGVFCVLDARTLHDERYTNHVIFKDQVESAHGIVLSHVDRYQSQDFDAVDQYLSQCFMPSSPPVVFKSDPMKLDATALDIGLTEIFVSSRFTNHSYIRGTGLHESYLPVSDLRKDIKRELSDHGRYYYQKQQDSMQVLGWYWAVGEYVDSDKLLSMIRLIALQEGVYRVKGVFALNPSEAVFVNVARGEVSSTVAPWKEVSRMEVIGSIDGKWPDKVKVGCEALI
ncbi:CobW family GTP-binding protein [Marinomonas foliarum]|uniref:G3E family GTPase n=1 Tax=Marinomonas foliarum TaxID=491950 RepID=A0A368ZN99_9GAMM|nr:GTP-binding protein [Marinomonas foliarum]RCW94659.1 G3E family GTPase [Marinomonas foliarum]